MGKSLKPPELKLSPLESVLQNLGQEQVGEIYPTQSTSVIDPVTSETLEQQRWFRTRDVIAKLGAGLIGIEEEQVQKDYYEEPVQDPDGYIRTYRFMKDLRTGEVKKIGLVRDAEAIKLEDIQNKKVEDPFKEQQIKNTLLGKMFQDTDPETGKFYKNMGMDLYTQSIWNSIPGAIISLGARALGSDNYRYPGADAFVNKLSIDNENGRLKFDNIPLNLPPEIMENTYEWFTRSATAEPEGFLDTFVSQGLTFALDLPFYMMGGGIVARGLSKVAPALMKSTSLLASIPKHQISTFGTLMLAGTPRTVSHTLEGGVDAFLEDVKHNAEFSLMAGVFGYAGEQTGIGVSKLFGRATRTSHNTLVDILRKNPQMVATLSGGFSSGALGYAVGGDNFEDRLATGLLFASMHFATPSAWKSFAKQTNKDVMVEKDTFDDLVIALKSGKTLNEALDEIKVTNPRYYIREGEKLYEIDKDLFTREGQIAKFEGSSVTYTPGEYQYITESIPFYRKLFKEAVKDVRLERIADKIEEQAFKDIPNPYPKGTEQYQEFEYNKRSTAERLALIHYSKELYKKIKNNSLPDLPGINEILKVASEGLRMPTRVYQQMIEPAFVEYIKNPEAFLATLKSEGGSLDFLPSEYRKSFESALPKLEVEVKRMMNGFALQNLERVKQAGAVKLNEALIEEFQRINDIAELNKFLEKTGWSTKVLEEVQKRVKANSLNPAELSEFINKHNEKFVADKLDYEGGVEILRREYRYWERMAQALTPDEIREIGRTGAITPEMRKALNELELELSKASEYGFENDVKVEDSKKEPVPSSAVVSKLIPEVYTFYTTSGRESKGFGEHSKIEVITESNYLKSKGFPVEEAEPKRSAYISVPNRQFIRVEVLDNIVTSSGQRDKFVLVRFENGEEGVISRDVLSGIQEFSSISSSRVLHEEIITGMAYKIESIPSNDRTRIRDFNFRAIEEWNRVMRETSVPYNNIFDYMLNLEKESEPRKMPKKLAERNLEEGKEARKKLKRFTEREITTFLEDPRPEKVKEFLDGTMSLPEAVERLEKAVEKLLADPRIDAKEKAAVKELMENNSKMLIIGKYLDTVRVGRKPVDSGEYVGAVYSLNWTLKARASKEAGYYPVFLALNESKTPASFIRALAHEIGHTIFNQLSPGFRKGQRVGGQNFLYNQPFEHSSLYGQVLKLREHIKLFFSSEADIIKSNDPVLYYWLRYMTDPGNSYQEVFTVGLTEPRVSGWLATIPASTQANPKYTLFHQLIDFFRTAIARHFGIGKAYREQIFDKKMFSALDEILDVTSQLLRENGLVDYGGNLIKGVASRSILKIYDEALERAGDPDNYFKSLLNETKDIYERTLSELEILEPVGGFERISNFAIGTQETGNTARIEREGSNISPRENLSVETKTFNLLAQNLLKETEVPGKSKLNIDTYAPIEGAYSEPKFEGKVKEAVKKDYPEESASVRVPKPPKQIAEFDKVRNERAEFEVKTVNNTPFKVKGKEVKVLPPARELAYKIYTDGRLYRGTRALKNYLYQSIVPVYRKDNAPRFRREVYEPGEELIRYAPYYFNTIVKRIDGWRGGEAWREFAKPERESGIPTTPDGKAFLEAFKNYEYGRYTNKIERELTWDEFAEWAKFNTSQKKMLDIYRGTLKAGIDVMKDLKTRFLVELEPKFASKYLKEKSLEEISKKYGVDADKLDEFLESNLKVKEELARQFIESKYKDWDKTVYYNSVRPITPYTIVLEFSKPTGQVDKDGNPIMDRFRTYAEYRSEAEAIVNDMVGKGWVKEEMYDVSSIIKHPDQWGKLKAEQLLKLAEEGHIPYNDRVVQALLEVTKKGIDIHSINKEYIPGMKYTAKEFEGQLIDFLREAIYGSYKSYTLTKINDNLLKWRSELNDLTKGLSKIDNKSIDDKTLRELEAEYLYAYGYYNQLKAPEKSIIDKLRGLTFSYLIGGIKPSFLFMQSVQNLQMGLHLAYKELGDFSQASKFLGEATTEAMNYAFLLKAKKRGEKLVGYPYDKELLGLLDKFEKMGKLKPVGISEMTGIEAEPDFYYSNKANRIVEGFIRVNNILGAGVEKLTRIQATGLFYKAGKAKGLEGETLEKFILDNLDKAMTEFGKGGRAPLFESKSTIPNQGTLVTALKKSFLSLKTFSFYNYSLYHNLIKEKAWGALGSKIMVGMGMHGIKSFPLMAGLFMIAGLFTDDDIDYQALKLANEIDELVPVPLGKFLDKGLASALGTGIDFSNTFAEDSPLLTDLIANSYSKTWEGKLLELSIGAPLGFSRNVTMGITELYDTVKENIINDQFLTAKQKQERLNKIAKLMPGVWVQNIIKAMEYNRDGVMLRGNQLVKREDLTEWDILMKAMSFPLEKVNVAYLEKDYGIEAKINKQKMIISNAKAFIKEMRTSKKLPLEVRIKEIEKATESMKEAKQLIIKLEKEKKENE